MSARAPSGPAAPRASCEPDSLAAHTKRGTLAGPSFFGSRPSCATRSVTHVPRGASLGTHKSDRRGSSRAADVRDEQRPNRMVPLARFVHELPRSRKTRDRAAGPRRALVHPLTPRCSFLGRRLRRPTVGRQRSARLSEHRIRARVVEVPLPWHEPRETAHLCSATRAHAAVDPALTRPGASLSSPWASGGTPGSARSRRRRPSAGWRTTASRG